MLIPKAILIAKRSCTNKVSLKGESPFFRDLFVTPLFPFTYEVNSNASPTGFVESIPGLPLDLVGLFFNSKLF